MVIEEREFVVDIDAFHQSNVGNIEGLNNTVTCLSTSDQVVTLKSLVGDESPPSKLLFAFDQLNQQRACSHTAFHPTTDSEKVVVGPEYGHL